MEKLWTWGQAYRGSGLLWVVMPDRLLVDYPGLLPKGRVLNLGVGEGRNGLFFVCSRYEVVEFNSLIVKAFPFFPLIINRLQKCISKSLDPSSPVAADFSLRSLAIYQVAAAIAIIVKILDW